MAEVGEGEGGFTGGRRDGGGSDSVLENKIPTIFSSSSSSSFFFDFPSPLTTTYELFFLSFSSFSNEERKPKILPLFLPLPHRRKEKKKKPDNIEPQTK